MGGEDTLVFCLSAPPPIPGRGASCLLVRGWTAGATLFWRVMSYPDLLLGGLSTLPSLISSFLSGPGLFRPFPRSWLPSGLASPDSSFSSEEESSEEEEEEEDDSTDEEDDELSEEEEGGEEDESSEEEEVRSSLLPFEEGLCCPCTFV